MHLLEHSLVASFHCQLTPLFYFKGVGGAGVVEVVNESSDEDVEPLPLGKEVLKARRSTI